MEADHYRLKSTRHLHTPPGVLKPDATILRVILDKFSVEPNRALYVGDSLMKDVAMGQKVGVVDVHAQYGVSTDREGYDLLRQVSHWSDQDVERERHLAQSDVAQPAVTLQNDLAELLDHFEFSGR
jgi:phosphoglycolate phosphatase